MRFAPGGRFYLGTSMDDISGILDELEHACGVRDEEAELPLHLLGS